MTGVEEARPGGVMIQQLGGSWAEVRRLAGKGPSEERAGLLGIDDGGATS